MLIKKLYHNLITPTKNGKKVGFFIALCAIFGGLIVSYLGMTLIGFLIPSIPNESIIVSLWFLTLVWAFTALWISLSLSKMSALLRVIIPTIIFSISLISFYKS